MKTMPLTATWMDIEIITLSEVSQTEKDKYNMISLICGIFFLTSLLEYNCFTMVCQFLLYMESLKNDTSELIFNREIDTQAQKTNLWLSKGKGGGINQEFEINIYTLLYIKQVTNKDLLYSTGKYTQYLVATYKGKESGKNKNICIYVYI